MGEWVDWVAKDGVGLADRNEEREERGIERKKGAEKVEKEIVGYLKSAIDECEGGVA